MDDRRSMKMIQTESAPRAVGPYSQGIVCNGFCFFSGQLGMDPKTSDLPETFPEQLEQILRNIDALLQAAGLSRTDIIKTTIFLADLAHFPLVNEAYERFFEKPYPARSCVQAAALPKGALVEIEVIAACRVT